MSSNIKIPKFCQYCGQAFVAQTTTTRTMSNKKQLQKLELTWIGKGEEPKLEPRILIENPEYSYGDPYYLNLRLN